jgi:hypothetical protein
VISVAVGIVRRMKRDGGELGRKVGGEMKT